MPTLCPDTPAASAESGSAETSAAPSRAPVSLQKTSAPSWPRPCSKRQPEPRQVRGPDATSAAQRFFPLEGLRPRAPVSLQKTSAPSWPRPCSKRQPEPRQVRGPDATSAAQRFFPLEGLRPYIILGASPGDGLTAGLPRGFPSEQVASVEESPGGKGAETPILQRGAVYVRRYVVMISGRRNMG